MPQKIGDRNPDVAEALQRLQDTLVMDERDTSRQSLVVVIPAQPDDEIQVIVDGISSPLEAGEPDTTQVLRVVTDALVNRNRNTS